MQCISTQCVDVLVLNVYMFSVRRVYVFMTSCLNGSVLFLLYTFGFVLFSSTETLSVMRSY